MKQDIEYKQVSLHTGYITGDKDFICSDIGVIQGHAFSMLIDAGASLNQHELFIAMIKQGKLKDNFRYIGITHFHPDHIKALPLYKGLNIIGTKNTSRYTPIDTLVSDSLTLDLGGVHVSIGLLPSIHAKGSLYFYVKEDKALFIGDGLCLKEKDGKTFTNKDITLNTAKVLLGIDTKYIIYGHNSTVSDLDAYNNYVSYLLKECSSAKTPEIELKQFWDYESNSH